MWARFARDETERAEEIATAIATPSPGVIAKHGYLRERTSRAPPKPRACTQRLSCCSVSGMVPRGLLMPSYTEHGPNRAGLASALRLLLVPVALLVLFHTTPVSALPPVVVPIAAISQDSADSTDGELPMCDLTDASQAVAPGSCTAAAPDFGARAAQERAAKAPADQGPADRAAPMCDVNAMSLDAPGEIPEIDRGHFEPLPCDAQALLSLLGSQRGEGGIQWVAAREALPRGPLHSSTLIDGIAAWSGPVYWPERSAPSTLAADRHGGLGWQLGHRSRIDRPPSLRA